MRHALELCALYAPLRRPIVIIGPVGAGKTSLASEIHTRATSPGRLVALSAGELSETLYRDALFGHRAGAFTGANRDRDGAFRQAASGTLLIDDLALLPHGPQASLLRVIESGRYRPLGATRDETADCRLIFASTRSPIQLAAVGQMLPDLASRLGEFTIEIPPLSQRRADILPLARLAAELFLREHGHNGHPSFPAETASLLSAYSWPSNVRELKAVIERATVHAGLHSDEVVIRPVHLPRRLLSFSQQEPSSTAELTPQLVEHVLREVGGNQSEAARRLGVHRNTIARYLRSVG